MPLLTLDEFRATKRHVPNISEANQDGCDHDESGFLYLDHLFICDPLENGNYWTILGNHEPEGTLEQVEEALYRWAVAEGYCGGR